MSSITASQSSSSHINLARKGLASATVSLVISRLKLYQNQITTLTLSNNSLDDVSVEIFVKELPTVLTLLYLSDNCTAEKGAQALNPSILYSMFLANKETFALIREKILRRIKYASIFVSK